MGPGRPGQTRPVRSITDNLSARVEYLYLDKGHIATGAIGPPATTITSRVQDNLVRAGLNYRFPIGGKHDLEKVDAGFPPERSLDNRLLFRLTLRRAKPGRKRSCSNNKLKRNTNQPKIISLQWWDRLQPLHFDGDVGERVESGRGVPSNNRGRALAASPPKRWRRDGRGRVATSEGR